MKARGVAVKKSIIAALILSGFAGYTHAQSQVTIYGVVDLGINYDKGASAAGRTVSLTSGQQFGSRIGFRGTENLGGGLSASFLLESGINADDGSLNNGGRLFGRQAWLGLEGGFGSIKLGRQYSAIYNALNAVDPFGLNQAGDAQQVFGYGLGKVDPISRSDNTIIYATPRFGGFGAAVGYKFGEVAGSFNSGSSKFIGASYVTGPANLQLAYQDTDGVALGAATTQLGSLVAPTGLGGATASVKSLFIGGTYDFGFLKAHLGAGDTKVEATGDARIRNYLVGVSAPVSVGTLYASWNRNDVRDIGPGTSDQYGVGYSHPVSKRTNFYTSVGYTKNDSGVRLNSFANGRSDREVQLGIRHVF